MTRDSVKVAVLCGGDSLEREVSLRSGARVHEALLREGFRAELIRVDSYHGLPQQLAPFPVVFNILHGGAGEDGTVQLLLELLGKAYVGSGPLSCAWAMDKHETHRLLAARGVPVPPWLTYRGGQLDQFLDQAVQLGFPLVIKPRDQGSSVGVFQVRDTGELASRAEEVLEGFGSLLVEKFIPGRELTCGVLELDGADTLPVVELRPRRGELFDWEAKYSPGACEFLCPAPLSSGEEERVARVAREAFLALGCRDLARVDIRLAEDGTPYVLELNTLPGLTEMSTLPRAAAAAGLPYERLVASLVERALARGKSHSSG
jgi:D-alanine-D-alanine ligase